MQTKIFLSFIFLIFSGRLLANDVEIDQKMQTKFGEVQVVRQMHQVEPSDAEYGKYKQWAGPPSDIALNGKIIFHANDSDVYVHLLGVYNFKDGQAVLISRNCGGSGCRIWPLTFIVLKNNVPPFFVTDNNFNSETYTDDDLKPKEKNGKIVIDLGYYKQQRKYANFDGTKLSFSYSDEHIKALDDVACRALYNSSDSCARLFEEKFACDQYAVGEGQTVIGSNADIWGRRWVMHHPGFNQKGFDQECLAACKTGKLSDYGQFYKNACVQP